MDAKKNERNINYTCIYNTIFFHTKYTYRTCLKKKLQKYWNFKQQTKIFLKYYTFCKTSYTSNMVIGKTRNDLSFLTQNGENQSIGKMSVQGQLDHITAEAQCTSRLDQAGEDVSLVKDKPEQNILSIIIPLLWSWRGIQ